MYVVAEAELRKQKEVKRKGILTVSAEGLAGELGAGSGRA